MNKNKKDNTNGEAGLCRFTISMPADLAAPFDALVREKGFANRSQAVAELARNWLVEHRGRRGSGEIAGTVTLVYDHHKPHIQAHLTAIQHEAPALIISALHAHLDACNCMEALAVRGPAAAIHTLADRLTAVKGVKHARLTVTTTGREFRHGHGHAHGHAHAQAPHKHPHE